MKACPTCGQRFLGAETFCPKDGATLVEMEKIEDPYLGVTLDGRYEIERKIGEGGMGVVYLASHAVIGKKYALKVLRAEMASEKEVAERFTQEARAAAAIGNEHIIEITDFGRVPDGAPYFVMELLDGSDLQTSLKSGGKLEISSVLHIIDQCCDALAAAHDAGIIHRDLKPENIFLVRKSQDSKFVKILDFGIAKVARESGRLTRTGMIFGTPQYMSPEQAAGTNIDHRTDVYSLGIIMYEMLCGHVPFEADTFMGVLTKHLYEEPIPPHRRIPPIEIPAPVEAVLLKAIAKKPDRRYQSMLDFGEDIRAIVKGETPHIVYDEVREPGDTTIPPPPPSSVVGKSKASSVELELPKRRWPIFAGVGVALVGAGALAFALLGGTEEGAPSPVSAMPRPEKSLAGHSGAPETQGAVASRAPAETELEVVHIVSVPEGAELSRDGAVLGKLPFDVPKPPVSVPEAKYTVKLAGYEDLEIIITPTTPKEHRVELKPEKAIDQIKPDGGGAGAGGSDTKGDGQKKKKDKKKRILGVDIADPWAAQ